MEIFGFKLTVPEGMGITGVTKNDHIKLIMAFKCVRKLIIQYTAKCPMVKVISYYSSVLLHVLSVMRAARM